MAKKGCGPSERLSVGMPPRVRQLLKEVAGESGQSEAETAARLIEAALVFGRELAEGAEIIVRKDDKERRVLGGLPTLPLKR